MRWVWRPWWMVFWGSDVGIVMFVLWMFVVVLGWDANI